MRSKIWATGAAAVMASGTPAHAAEFVMVFDGVPEAAQPDLRRAGDILAPCLVSDVPIRVRVTWIERGPTGYAQQPSFRNRPFLPKADVWYPSALANALSGSRIVDQDDINIFLSGETDWYLDGDTPIAEGQTDLVGVMMHEIGHGLGLSTGTYTPWEGEPVTSIGLPNPFDNYFDLSFERSEQDGTPTLYDSLLRLADGRGLGDFGNPSIELTYAIANPTIHFVGEQATKANRGYPVAVAPLSVSHIPGLPRSAEPMMANASGQGQVRRENDPLALAMLADLGWTIADECRSWD